MLAKTETNASPEHLLRLRGFFCCVLRLLMRWPALEPLRVQPCTAPKPIQSSGSRAKFARRNGQRSASEIRAIEGEIRIAR